MIERSVDLIGVQVGREQNGWLVPFILVGGLYFVVAPGAEFGPQLGFQFMFVRLLITLVLLAIAWAESERHVKIWLVARRDAGHILVETHHSRVWPSTLHGKLVPRRRSSDPDSTRVRHGVGVAFSMVAFWDYQTCPVGCDNDCEIGAQLQALCREMNEMAFGAGA